MNEHPENGVAAFLMSGVTVEQDYIGAGQEQLLRRAKLAMHDAEFQQITTEYKQYAGVWDTTTVLMDELQDQVEDALQEAGDANKISEMNTTMAEKMPWVMQSATEARKRWVEETK